MVRLITLSLLLCCFYYNFDHDHYTTTTAAAATTTTTTTTNINRHHRSNHRYHYHCRRCHRCCFYPIFFHGAKTSATPADLHSVTSFSTPNEDTRATLKGARPGRRLTKAGRPRKHDSKRPRLCQYGCATPSVVFEIELALKGETSQRDVLS